MGPNYCSGIISTGDILSQGEDGDSVVFIVTNKKKFSPSARHRIRSETAKAIARRRSEEQDRLCFSPPKKWCSEAKHKAMQIPASLTYPFIESAAYVNEDIRCLFLYRDTFVPSSYTKSLQCVIDNPVEWGFSRALHDPLVFHSILSAVNAHTSGLRLVRQRNKLIDSAAASEGTPSALQTNINAHRLKGMQLLRQRLSMGNIDDSLGEILCAALHLLHCEIHHGSREGILTHLHGIQQMLKYTRAVQLAPLSVLVSAVAMMYLAAGVTQTLPDFPAFMPQIMISAETWKLISDTSVFALCTATTGINNPSTTALLGEEVMQIVDRRRVSFAASEVMANEQLVNERTGAEFAYFYASRRRVDYDILVLLHDPTIKQHPLRICALYALFFIGYFNGIINFRANALYAQVFCQRYHKFLALTLSEDNTIEGSVTCPEIDLIIWLLFVGCHISHGQGERAWFLAKLTAAASVAGIIDIGQLKEILLTFLVWNDRKSLDTSLRDIWDDLTQLSTTSTPS